MWLLQCEMNGMLSDKRICHSWPIRPKLTCQMGLMVQMAPAQIPMSSCAHHLPFQVYQHSPKGPGGRPSLLLPGAQKKLPLLSTAALGTQIKLPRASTAAAVSLPSIASSAWCLKRRAPAACGQGPQILCRSEAPPQYSARWSRSTTQQLRHICRDALMACLEKSWSCPGRP